MRRERNLRRKISYTAAFIMISTLLALFFIQFNSLVRQGNLLKNHTEKIGELSRENGNLEISSLEKNGLENIEKVAKELNFEKVEKIHYIRVLEGTVVSR